MENEAKEQMELITEAIFSVLYHDGDMELKQLQEKVNASEQAFEMAIGSLVEKDDIELIPHGESFIAHRTSPAPAVFPFRSN